MDIGGESGNFQLARDDRIVGIGEVEDKERVGLFEGDNISPLAVKAR